MIQRDLRKEPVHDGLKPIESALGCDLNGWMQHLSYDLLMANVDAVSVLFMEDVSPLAAADVNVAADSSATVNLVDNAVLTGTVTATSTIGYFGSNVSVLVVNDLSSSVTRLGPSRP